jgi:hypothetical protein
LIERTLGLNFMPFGDDPTLFTLVRNEAGSREPCNSASMSTGFL